MNKWMKSGLGAALAVAMLAGSGNAAFAAEDFENKELSIAVFEGGFGSDYWYSVVDAFEQAYPGVKVDMQISPTIADPSADRCRKYSGFSGIKWYKLQRDQPADH